MRRLCLSLFLFASVAEARHYAGTTGWANEHAGISGKVDYSYEDGGWVGRGRFRDDKFSLTLKFKSDHGLVLPQAMTASAFLHFNDPLDPFEGGGILPTEEDYSYYSRPIGWFYCEGSRQRRSCTMEFRGIQGLSDEPYSWVELQKTYEFERLCYLSGRWRAHYGSDEDTLVWHSKRLCN